MNDRNGSAFAELTTITDSAAAATDGAAAQADTAIRRMRLDDLSFHKSNVNLRETPEAIHGSPWWNPDRTSDFWDDNVKAGQRYFDEVAVLASFDEVDAFKAIRHAITSSRWRGGGAGHEEGFAEGIASAAVLGLAAIRAGTRPFSPGDFALTTDETHLRVKGLSGLETRADTFAADESMYRALILSDSERSDVSCCLDSANELLNRMISNGEGDVPALHAVSVLLERCMKTVGEA